MLIPYENIAQVLNQHNIRITGVLHIGAHDCEELDFYRKLSIPDSEMVWIDAIEDKVEQCKQRGIKNVYNEVVSDKDDEEIIFNRTNNDQSSSILELNTHKLHYGHIHVVSTQKMKTITIDSFLEKYIIDPKPLNFWNFDIQGAELLALKGAEEAIKFADAIYLEVNFEELYKGCALINELDEFLHSKGFQRVLTAPVPQQWGDALYIRK